MILSALLGPGCGNDSPSHEAATLPAGAPAVRDLSPPDAGKPRKVLLVHSYHLEYEWVAGISRGVKRALEQTGVELEVFYMDTKRKTDEAWKIESGKLARKTVADWQPDVVIAVDDNAQKYFASHYAGKASPRIVFCGVNGEPQDYGYPAPNVTGVLERPHLRASLDWLRMILPGTRRIAVITDNSPTSDGALRFMKKVKTGFDIVSWETPITFAAWQAAVQRAQDTADAIVVYMYHTVKDEGTTRSIPPKTVMEWTVAHSKIPLVGLFTFSVDDGMLCGIVESAVEHGLEAGVIARQILNGTSPSDIPVRTAIKGRRMLNLTTARQLGIDVPRSLIETTDIVIGDTDGA